MKTAALIGGGLLIIYSVAICWKKRSEMFSWLHTAVATVASILIGVSVAISLFNYQESVKEANDKRRYHELVSAEVSGIRSHLNNLKYATVRTASQEPIEIAVIHLRGEVLRDAGRSGLFDVQASHQMLELAQSIDAWNMKTEGLLGALNANPSEIGYENRLQWYVSNLESSKQGLLAGTQWLEGKLDLKKFGTHIYYAPES